MNSRSDFPILAKANFIYFDSASTSLKPKVVILAESSYYLEYGTNVHRGLSPLAEITTDLFENSRRELANFISAKSSEIIFTSGATMSINLVARSWGEANLKKDDVVLLSIAEHHSNLVPWLQLKEKIGIKLLFIPVHEDGSLNLEAALKLLKTPKLKLLAITQVSNVLGIIFPLQKLLALAKQKKIITLVDATASAAHLAIDVQDLDCDFLVFSAHKMYGPSGLGILYGRQELLEKMPAFIGGGGMINSVSTEKFSSADLPAKFEGGTPNIAGVIALGEACRYIKMIGWKNIVESEEKLTKYFLQEIKKLDFVQLLGSATNKLPIFSLVLDGVHPHDAADLLGQEGIIVRAGHHCAEPLHQYFKKIATLRVSLSFYNTKSEIDIFIKALKELHLNFK